MATQPFEGLPQFRAALGQFAAELLRRKGPDRIVLVNQLRRLAIANELHNAAEVVSGMAAAIAREEGAALLGPWLAAIDHAATIGEGGEDVAPVLFATVGVSYAH